LTHKNPRLINLFTFSLFFGKKREKGDVMGDSSISGMGSVNPHDRKMYEQEYKHSADLFQRALNQYQKSEDPNQQAEFKDVMDRALQILNETATGLMRSELAKQNAVIAKDYDTFQNFPGDPDTVDKLKSDLENAKKSV
jgi:hypothetical protein